MSKKQAIIKRSNGNINITIENNLKAVQTNEPVRRRRRRKPKPTDVIKGEANNERLPPLKDVSYIKPPGNSFNVWRDTIDSYNTSIPIGQAQQMGLIMAPPPPAPPAPPLALPPPANNTFNIGNSEGNSNGPTWRDFNNYMMSNRPTRRYNYGDNMLDDGLDDEEDTLQRAFVPQGPPRPPESVEQDIIPDSVIDSIPDITDEQKTAMKTDQQEKNRIKQARKEGTIHGKKGIEPKGNYKDMDEYTENYQKALILKKIEDERREKQANLDKTAMYNKGKEDATKGKALKNNRYRRDQDYLRGYNEIIDLIPQEAGPAAGS